MSEVEPASATAWFAAQSDLSTRTIYSKSFSARLRRLDDVGPGDLVVPTLLVGVEGHPDHADQDDDDGDEQPDISNERRDDADVAAIGFDHTQVEQLVADGLTGPDTAGRPEVAEVDDAQQRLNAGAAGGRLAENRGNDQIDNAEDDAVDDERKDSDPESGLGCGGERGRRRRTSGLHRSPPSFGASIAPVSERKPNSAGVRPIESRDGRRGPLPEVGVFQQQGGQSPDGRARSRPGSDRARPRLRPALHDAGPTA